MSATTTAPDPDQGHDPDELLTITQVSALGFGHPQTIRKRIYDGDVPAVRCGKIFKIRRGDLVLLYEALGPGSLASHLARTLMRSWPSLSEDRKAELRRLLADPADDTP